MKTYRKTLSLSLTAACGGGGGGGYVVMDDIGV